MDVLDKILFISLSNIGDAVMTTPALHELHRAFPGAVIDIVAGSRSLPVFLHCPYRGEIFLKDKKKLLRGYPDLLRQLRRTHYGLVVDLRTDGFSLLLKASKRYQKRRSRGSGMHAVQEHLAIIEDLTGVSGRPETHIWLSDEEINFAKTVMHEFADADCLAIGPGCGGPEKVWPADRFAALANDLQDVFSGVVLLGGPGDSAYAAEAIKTMKCRTLDLTGKTDILQAVAVIKQCKLFIGNDSGLGHLASAVATPSLTLFGVGQPDRYHPWQDKAAWLTGHDHEVRNIPVEQALESVQKLLS